MSSDHSFITLYVFSITDRIEEHEKTRKLERGVQLKDQATIEEDVLKYFEEEKAKESQRLEKKMTLRKELDKVVADKTKLEQRQAEQEEAEASEGKIFADAKKVCTACAKRLIGGNCFLYS